MRRYPRGKLRADDEGQLAMKMCIQDNTLLIVFGKPVGWFGLGLQEVRELRRRLGEYEKQLEENES